MIYTFEVIVPYRLLNKGELIEVNFITIEHLTFLYNFVSHDKNVRNRVIKCEEDMDKAKFVWAHGSWIPLSYLKLINVDENEEITIEFTL